jgi:hypothetical protein
MQFIHNREEKGLTFPDLDVTFTADSWGPVQGARIALFDNVPYAHFDKKERCNRHADFTQNPAMQRYVPKSRRIDDSMLNADFVYKHDAVEDSTFQLVDTSKTQSRNKFIGGMYCGECLQCLFCI